MKHHQRKLPKGVTLLELTVVILVLLSLMGILFVGARAWKSGSDRSNCIINIRNIQQAVRSHQNLNGLADGTSLDVAADLTGPTNYLGATATCPAGGTYTYESTIPTPGTLMTTCSFETTFNHVPVNYAGW
ncbi:type II secretion system protein [Haloferula sp.]|uniref:type II secretion system protein n=1 Tax=Haloferula sp. TaxID=2497595 RepID=UPI003C711872